VITHGTDTLEETTYPMNLLVRTRVPVILTGAMRSPDQPGSAAAANLQAAALAAATPKLSGFGPVVVMHDEIHGAAWVRKIHASRVAALGSPECGRIGVSEGHVVLMHRTAHTSRRLPNVAPPAKRVELLWAAAGTDRYIIDRIRDGLDGLVVAGTGGGHVTPALGESLEALANAGCSVVIASRCGAGPTLTHTCEGPGSEPHLLARGIPSAGQLDPSKCRLRLQFGLSAGISARELFPCP
jgi:L-asparaginase